MINSEITQIVNPQGVVVWDLEKSCNVNAFYEHLELIKKQSELTENYSKEDKPCKE